MSEDDKDVEATEEPKEEAPQVTGESKKPEGEIARAVREHREKLAEADRLRGW